MFFKIGFRKNLFLKTSLLKKNIIKNLIIKNFKFYYFVIWLQLYSKETPGFLANIAKFLKTAFLQNTSYGCFCTWKHWEKWDNSLLQ